MGKNIVVSFPGGRGYEIPILYFGAKHYEDLGYEKVLISHLNLPDFSFEAILKNAENIIKGINFNDYDEIVFIGKSIGTEVACIIKEKYQIPASLVLFTPIEETLPYIKENNDIILIAAGSKDKYLETDKLQVLCEAERISCYIEPNVGHRMEVLNDLKRNLQIVENVVRRIV